jgi:prophage regulatory protein
MSFRQSAIKHDPRRADLLPPPPPTPKPDPSAGRITDERLLRLPELVRTIGVSRATIYRYIDSGRLPPPVKLSTRCIAWRASEITAWMAALQAA